MVTLFNGEHSANTQMTNFEYLINAHLKLLSAKHKPKIDLNISNFIIPSTVIKTFITHADI